MSVNARQHSHKGVEGEPASFDLTNADSSEVRSALASC